MCKSFSEDVMETRTDENWTEPGSDSFNQRTFDTSPEASCVYCGDYDPEFREHFMTHYAAAGGEYGRYSSAYELGHNYAHENGGGDWSGAESHLREKWESRAQGPWEDFKDAVKFGWARVRGKH